MIGSRCGGCLGILSLAAFLVACGDKGEGASKPAGELASGLASALLVASAVQPPVLCAVWPSGNTPDKRSGTSDAVDAALEAAGFELAGMRLNSKPDSQQGGESVKIAVVADAREPSTAVIRAIEEITKQFEASSAKLVVSLGGMGQTQEQLTTSLRPLASSSRVLIAAPGDTESVSALEATVATLRSEGLPVFTTSEIRTVAIGETLLAVLPGVGDRTEFSNTSGDGCLHRDVDAAAMAQALAAHQGSRLWLSYLPPLQRGEPQATDLSEGVHLGSEAIRAALALSGVAVVVHGRTESIAQNLRSQTIGLRKIGQATSPTILGVQPLEPVPGKLGGPQPPFAALLLEIKSSKIEWRSLARQNVAADRQ